MDYSDTVVVSLDQGMKFPSLEYVQAKITKEMKNGKLHSEGRLWLKQIHNLLKAVTCSMGFGPKVGFLSISKYLIQLFYIKKSM